MSTDLHLFSEPGEGDLRYILDACRPYLEGQARPRVACIQWASVSHDWLPYTHKAFAGLAEVEALDHDPACAAASCSILDRCHAVYISGGNTYLLNHRLHESGLLEELRGRARAGMPIVGFSAGAMVCGANILTNQDVNMVPTVHFEALELLPYNLLAHYPPVEHERAAVDEWLSDYHALHDEQVIALEDDAYVRWDGQSLACRRGAAWLLEPRKVRAPLA